MIINNYRHWLLLTIILFAVFSLTGCVKFRYHMTLNSNKTVEEDIIIGLDETLMAFAMAFDDEDFLEELRVSLIDEGFVVESYRANEVIGVRAFRSSTSLDDVITIENEFFTNADREISVERSLFGNTYHFNLSFDMEDFTEEDLYMFAMMQPDMSFVLTLPVKPTNHNAHIISGDGKTLEWQFIPGQINNMQVSFREPAVALIIFIIALIFLVSIYLILRFGKFQFQTSATAEHKIKSYCPECKSSIDAGETFCTNCGKEINFSEMNNCISELHCKSCGHSLEATDRFCSECGSSK